MQENCFRSGARGNFYSRLNNKFSPIKIHSLAITRLFSACFPIWAMQKSMAPAMHAYRDCDASLAHLRPPQARIHFASRALALVCARIFRPSIITAAKRRTQISHPQTDLCCRRRRALISSQNRLHGKCENHFPSVASAFNKVLKVTFL